MSTKAYEYDLFISYRRIPDDQEWLHTKLLPALEEADVSVCLDDFCFRLGAPLVLEMERAVLESRFTLGIFTPEYADSGFTELEQVMAKHLGAEEREVRFIGLIYRDCTLPLLSRSTLLLDMRDEKKFDVNVARLVKTLKNS